MESVQEEALKGTQESHFLTINRGSSDTALNKPSHGLKIVSKEYPLLNGTSKILVQRVGDGSIITRFEKTPIPTKPSDVICPHFLELKWATGCPYNCSWCYLNGTLRFAPNKAQPYLKDYNRIERHVCSFLENGCCDDELLNTGELADSLMYEKSGNPFSKFILSLFHGRNGHKVLFVTKSTNIENLLEMDFQSHAIVSFSLNAPEAARMFEKGAPTVAERIEAAKKLSNAGYEVRIRIDPMVPIASWDEGYKALVDMIFHNLVPSRITLGSLRGLQSTINQSPDKSWVQYLSEKSNWGKRVASITRYEMYHAIISYLEETYNYTEVSLCKETVELWGRLGMDYRGIRCNCVL